MTGLKKKYATCFPDPNITAIVVSATATTGMMLGAFGGPAGAAIGFSGGFLAATIGGVAVDAYNTQACMNRVDHEETKAAEEAPAPAPAAPTMTAHERNMLQMQLDFIAANGLTGNFATTGGTVQASGGNIQGGSSGNIQFSDRGGSDNLSSAMPQSSHGDTSISMCFASDDCSRPSNWH